MCNKKWHTGFQHLSTTMYCKHQSLELSPPGSRMRATSLVIFCCGVGLLLQQDLAGSAFWPAAVKGIALREAAYDRYRIRVFGL